MKDKIKLELVQSTLGPCPEGKCPNCESDMPGAICPDCGLSYNQHIDKIIRGCAPTDMYCDNSYCEHRIKRCENIYYREVQGTRDTHCSDCMLHIVLAAVKARDVFTYEDKWKEEFEALAWLKLKPKWEILKGMIEDARTGA